MKVFIFRKFDCLVLKDSFIFYFSFSIQIDREIQRQEEEEVKQKQIIEERLRKEEAEKMRRVNFNVFAPFPIQFSSKHAWHKVWCLERKLIKVSSF